MKTKKIISTTVSLMMLLGSANLPAVNSLPVAYAESAETEAVTMDEDAVIAISTADELRALRDEVNKNADYSAGKTFKLAADIDLGGETWVPIGYAYVDDEVNAKDADRVAYAFCGTFDGDGHTISNFKLSNESYDYSCLGLFAYVNGEIKNLNISDASVEVERSYAEGEVPYMLTRVSLLCGGIVGNISNCRVEGTISIDNQSANAVLSDTAYSNGFAATRIGMVAASANGEVSDCYASGSIDSYSLRSYIGGIVGVGASLSSSDDEEDKKGTLNVKNCTSDVTISAISCGAQNTGGIVGYINYKQMSGSEIADCAYSSDGNAGIAIEAKYSDNLVDEPDEVEKLLGEPCIGGIVGKTKYSVKSCTVGEAAIKGEDNATGLGEDTGGVRLGGIVGDVDGKVEDCRSSAKLHVKSAGDGSTSVYVGGIAGVAGKASSEINPFTEEELEENASYIKNCFSDASLTIETNGYVTVGGIAGTSQYPVVISDCTTNNLSFDFVSNGNVVYLSGISAYNRGAEISRCKSEGDIYAKPAGTPSLYVGGICGSANTQKVYKSADYYERAGAGIYDCVTEGSVTSVGGKQVIVGGISGYLYGKIDSDGTLCDNHQPEIRRCVSKADVTLDSPTGTAFVGGILGYVVDSEISDCRAEGSVGNAVAEGYESKSAFMGGVIGRVKMDNATITEQDDTLTTVENCYAANSLNVDANGKITSGSFTSQISGNKVTLEDGTTVSVLPAVNDCYYLVEDASAVSEDAVGTAIEADALASETTFANWDFQKVWTMSDDRPVLRYENTCAYEWNVAYDNGAPVALNSVTIAKPVTNSRIYIKVSDLLTKTETVYVRNIENSGTSDFEDIELGIDLPILYDVSVYVWDENLAPLCDVSSFE